MLTLKLISEETERVIKGLEKKHFDGAREAIEKVLAIDTRRRDAQQKFDLNKQEANRLSKQIGALMKSGKNEEAEAVKMKVAELKTTSNELKEEQEKAEKELVEQLCAFPIFPMRTCPRVRMRATMLS